MILLALSAIITSCDKVVKIALSKAKKNHYLIEIYQQIPPGGAGPLNFEFNGNKAIFPRDRGAVSEE